MNTAFVINIERRKDRWEAIQQAWHGRLNLIRIPAVELPGNGVSGCKLSHQMVAAHFLKTEPMVLVLEDDATPTEHWDRIGNICIEDARLHLNEWRIANLGPYLDITCLGLGRANLQPTKSEHFLSASYCQQTHMMLYNRKSIPILQEALRSPLPLDIYIGRMVNDVWVPIHLLATQSDSPSDIPKPRVDANALYSLSERMLSAAVNKK